MPSAVTKITRNILNVGDRYRSPIVVLSKQRVLSWTVVTGVVAFVSALAGLDHDLAAEPDNAQSGIRTKILIAGPTKGSYASRPRDIEAGVRVALRDLGVAPGESDIEVLGDKCGRSRMTQAEPVVPATNPADKIRLGNKPDIVLGVGIIGPTIVIGHPCARAALAAAKTYARLDQLFLAPVTRHPALTDGEMHRTTLRLTGRDEIQGRFAGRYLAKHFSARDVFIVHDRTAFARRLVGQVETAWPLLPQRKAATTDELAGVARDMPTVLKFVASKASYPDIVAKIKEAQPKALYLAAFPPEARIIVDELAVAGVDLQIFGPDVLAVPPMGLARTDNPDAVLQSPYVKIRISLPTNATTFVAAASAVARLKREGLKPTDAMLRGYAAVEVWWAARRRAISTSGADLAAAAKAIVTDSVIGPLSFDSNGDLEMPSYAFHRYGKNGYVPENEQ